MGAVTETCSCGARFDYSGQYAGLAATEWRKNHRCAPAGPPRVSLHVDPEQVQRAVARTVRAVPRRRRTRRRWRFRVT